MNTKKLRPGDLPAPPQSAIQIVHLCSKEDVESRELAEAITHDPVLTAEVLRICNSPLFGTRSEIRTAAHAVNLLGQRAIRNLALCIAMRDAVQPESIPGLPIDQYWETALRRAVCARMLAPFASVDVDECFTIGLLQDVGLLVMFYLQQEKAQAWPILHQANPDERYGLERETFGTTHDEVGLELAEAWALPHDLKEAVGYHHSQDHEGASELGDSLRKVALCADWMAAVFCADDPVTVVGQAQEQVTGLFAIGAAEFEELLARVGAEVEDAAQILGFGVAEQLSLEQVLGQANLKLAEDNLTYQQLNWELESTLAERDRIHAELNRELEFAREVQKSLLPDETVSSSIHGINISAKSVSGDFYDYFGVRGSQIYFCIADVSGKGMHAALLMAKTSSLFRCLGKGVFDPGKLLQVLNGEIFETSVRGMFVTMIAGIYDLETGLVRMVNAGHLPAFHLRADGELAEYPAQDAPLGVLADTRYSSVEFSLADGSLYLFTDGLQEARIGAGERLETAGALDLIRRFSKLPPVERLRQIAEHVTGTQVCTDDDLTLLVIDAPSRSV